MKLKQFHILDPRGIKWCASAQLTIKDQTSSVSIHLFKDCSGADCLHSFSILTWSHLPYKKNGFREQLRGGIVPVFAPSQRLRPDGCGLLRAPGGILRG